MPNNKQEILNRGEDRVVVTDSISKNQGDAVLSLQGALVKGPIKIDRGLFSRFRVYEGTEAVVVLDGQYHETVRPGGHFTMAFPILRRLEQYVVDIRDRALDVHVWDDLRIAYRTTDNVEMAIPISLRIIVGYRVVDSATIALKVQSPLGTLYDYVLEAMRMVVARTRYEDFQYGTHAGQLILQNLTQRGLDSYLGIQPINVQVAEIGGAEAIDSSTLDDYTALRDAERKTRTTEIAEESRRRMELQDALNRGDVAKAINMSPEYLLRYHPDMYERVFGNQAQSEALKLQAIVELVRSGMVSANQLGISGLLGTPGAPALNQNLLTSGTNTTTTAPNQTFQSFVIGRERILKDVQDLLSTGLQAQAHQSGDEMLVTVGLQDADGHALVIYLKCPPNYPQVPPEMFVELDGQQQQFSALTLDQWTPTATLGALVAEVMTAFA